MRRNSQQTRLNKSKGNTMFYKVLAIIKRFEYRRFYINIMLYFNKIDAPATNRQQYPYNIQF